MNAVAIVLVLDALASGFFGVKWAIDPVAMATPLGIVLTNGDALSDARAVYGGLEIGIALLLVHCARRADLRTLGLLAATLTLGGLGLTRVGSVLLAAAPITGATKQLLVTDFLGVVVNGALWARSHRAAKSLRSAG